MTPTTTGAEDRIGWDTLEDFLNASKRIWVVFTVWIIHSLHHIMSYQPHTYLHNVSLLPQWLTQLPKLFFMQQFTAFVNEWNSSLLCKYHGHANPAEIFDQEINFGAIYMKYNKRNSEPRPTKADFKKQIPLFHSQMLCFYWDFVHNQTSIK